MLGEHRESAEFVVVCPSSDPYGRTLAFSAVGKSPGTSWVTLPLAFSKLLFGQTAVGMTVVITSHPDYPHNATEPDLDVAAPRDGVGSNGSARPDAAPGSG